MGTEREGRGPGEMQSESLDEMQHTEEEPEHCRHDLTGVLSRWLD
jgi:hypothetical protein